MPDKTRQIRRTRPSHVADFDDQLWPINCALLILAGFVTGIVIAVSDFGDPRLLYNGWVRLGGVAAVVGVLFWGVRWLEGRMLRRLQFCLLLSLVAHLALAVCLRDRYLALVADWDTGARDQVVEQYREITLPDYYWKQIEEPHAQQSFEQPIATEVPRPTEPESLRREAQPPEILPRTTPPEQPDVPQRQQPDPAATRRAELSAPRRAEAAAGAQISRQPLRDVAVANRPIDVAQIAPQPSQTAAPPNVETAARRQPELPVAIAPSLASPDEPRSGHDRQIEARLPQQVALLSPAEALRSEESRSAMARRLLQTPVADLAIEAASLAASPVATGAAPPSRLPLVADATMLRSAGQPPVDNQTTATTPDLAAGTSEAVARAGQPRAAGLGPSAATTTAAERRIARAASPAAPSTLSGAAETEPMAPDVAASGVGESGLISLNAQATAARRGATVRPLASEPAIGAGPVGASGTPGPVETDQRNHVTRYESVASAIAGGGTPRPGRTTGGSAAPSAVAESTEPVAVAPGGTAASDVSAWQASVRGPEPTISGLPGLLRSQPASGVAESLADRGTPLRQSAARRADGLQQESGGQNRTAPRNATARRAAAEVDLVVPAVPIDAAVPSGAGAVALVQGASLLISPVAAMPRSVADLPVDQAVGSVGDSPSVDGAARAVVVAGQARLASDDRPVAGETHAAGQRLTRSMADGPTIDSSPAEQSVASAHATEDYGPATDPGSGVPSAVLDQPSRQEGGLAVEIAAVEGPGGLGYLPSPELGIPSLRARPESETIHTIFRRFVVDRSSGEMPIDGRVREAMSEPFRQRDPVQRANVAQAWGGSERTEQAVELGLDYLARRQFPDGHWSLDESPPGVVDPDAALGEMESDSAATGLALLSFLGAGYTHLDGKYRGVVGGGIDWLVRSQKPSGELFTGGTGYARFYSHAIASIALCEAYGMTRDGNLVEPTRRAIALIVATQHPTRGGWRYELDPRTGRATETDTSVSGWMLMALKSAQMAGLEVPLETFERLDAWLDSAAALGAAGQYVYNPHAPDTPEQRAGRSPSLAMSAEGMLMRMYLGYDRSDPRLVAGARYLKDHLPQIGSESSPLRDCYYWYYATQAMFQMQGDYWTAWNDRLRPLLVDSQVASGPLAGSWNPLTPVEDRWGRAAGRHYVTALHLLMLEVYYRHLPLFQQLGQ